ncbi:MAG: transposase, partial [Acidobacteria bacterium]|nr:transposase [Acidobacteriota bacterium]
LFVAVLGASSFTYAEATATQQLADWVGAHTWMVEYFGGATALWVPDQLKSAITRPCRCEPDVNRTYEELAAHYGAVVVPARPRKPVIRLSSRRAYSWSNGGSWPGSATRPSSSSARSTRRSASCSTSS